VATLNLFPATATDCSVTWKHTFGSSSTEYKVGILLHGNNTATTSTGYVSGIMQGYLFLINHNTSRTYTEFRIYKPMNSNMGSIDRITTGTVSIVPAVNTPMWYRATATGSSPVYLKFEYSTDSTSWNTAASTSDASSPYASGATQIVWGLASNGFDFYMDNITFNGSTNALSPVKETTLSNATVVSTEYYTLSGIRVNPRQNVLKGLYVLRSRMSDGTIVTSKVLFR
jgi:hypothetical protein